jgi:hypothetical protein
MSKITLTSEQTRYLFREEGCDEFDLVLHEEGDWDVDIKYQHLTNIYFQESTGKYFEMAVSRSGSPFTDWSYSFEYSGSDLVEVKLVEKVITTKTWVRV